MMAFHNLFFEVADQARRNPAIFYAMGSIVWLYFWRKMSWWLPRYGYFRNVYFSFLMFLPLLFLAALGTVIFRPDWAATIEGSWFFRNVFAHQIVYAAVVVGCVLCPLDFVLFLIGLIYVPMDPLEERMNGRIRFGKVNHAKYLAAADGLTYLGYDAMHKKPVYLNEKQRNSHLHIVGSTGTGKTRYVIMPMMRQDICAGRGVVFIDAKGSLENARAVYKMACDAGREKDWLFFSLTNLPNDLKAK